MKARRDDAVVTRAKAGDPDAWRELHQAHAMRLRVWLDAIPTGDPAADADDVAASAWLTASRRILEFNGTSSDFAGWLFTIARNVARTTYARSGRRSTHPTDVATSDPTIWGTADDPSAAVEAAEAAYRLIRRLSKREAEVVACIDLAGFDISSTAAILGISEVAVRVSHHRGIDRLRTLLADADLSGEDSVPRRSVRAQPSPGVAS